MVSAVANRWKPYPEYKSIQHAGIEKIPNHWDSNRMRYVFRERGEVSEDGTEELLSVSKYTGVKVRSTTTDREARAASLVGYKKCEPNDIVSNIMLAWDSALGVSFDSGIVSSAYEVYVPQQEIDPYFLDLLLRTPEYRVAFTIVSKGIVPSRWRMYTESFNDIQMILPSLSEQKQIGNFVHMINQNISGNIKNLETQISLLEEKRSALITQAVTKGLNPDVPMKDSGIEWIGEIPSHWDLMAFKRMCRPTRGQSPRPIGDPKYWDDEGEYGWVRISDVTSSGKYLKHTRDYLTPLGKSKSLPLKHGELIISIAATVGVPSITDMKCCIHDGFVHFTGLEMNLDYVYNLLTIPQIFTKFGKKGTQTNINSEIIGMTVIPVPPEDEQHRISHFIQEKVMEIDLSTKNIIEHIEKLKEYRTALISAAVTGKIDVRGIA